MLKRAGHTEAAVDLARLAGLEAAGVLAEVVNDDGSMARCPTSRCSPRSTISSIISIADLIRFRRHREKLVRRVSEARIPTVHGDFTAYVFESLLDGTEHMAFVHGEVAGKENVLVRVHSECLTGDVFGSMRCDCGLQLDPRDETDRRRGRGRGRVPARARGPRHRPRPQVPRLHAPGPGSRHRRGQRRARLPADSREYGIGAQMLVDLGVSTMRIMTNNPAKYGGLEGYGLEIVERVPLHVLPNDENIRYLRTKQEKMGHLLDIDESRDELRDELSNASGTAANGESGANE